MISRRHMCTNYLFFFRITSGSVRSGIVWSGLVKEMEEGSEGNPK